MKKPTESIPRVLQPLVQYLDNLTGRAPLDELSTLLQNCGVQLRDVRPYVHFDWHQYRRNLVKEGQWYSLLVLCWRSGQRSPIHDHPDASCAFKVLTGVCTETVFDTAPCGQVFPVYTRDRPKGVIVATQDADTHQVSNLQTKRQDLVTLHIYTPPLRSMNRYSIMGEGKLSWAAPEKRAAKRPALLRKK